MNIRRIVKPLVASLLAAGLFGLTAGPTSTASADTGWGKRSASTLVVADTGWGRRAAASDTGWGVI